MAKKNGRQQQQASVREENKAATLKDLLNPDVVNKLKEQAAEMKRDEENRREQERMKAEEARRQEQKRLESSFEYLLDNSSQDWKKFK
ncbi:YqkE family protein [Paenibacillus pinistramenti]|uniref:YqkE family protein n=1 Tax=Paenibacillus pinistramenti TaxID=1768003 RepID=UPI001108D42C|nr:YqkE family protein [Paenibacillus pinistramenti]